METNYEKEINRITKEMAEMPEEERIDYSTSLLNGLIERLNQMNMINVHKIFNGQYSFGDLEYNQLILLSIITMFIPDNCFKMKVNEHLFVLGINTKEGVYLHTMSFLLWEGFGVVEKEFDNKLLEQEQLSLDVLFSLFENS